MADLNLKVLLENIRIEATKLQRDGMGIDEAYARALVEVVKVTAEAQDISPFEARVLAAMNEIQRNQGGRPVGTMRVAVEVGVDSRFAMYAHLRDLEKRGLVMKAGGRNSKMGWLLAA